MLKELKLYEMLLINLLFQEDRWMTFADAMLDVGP